MQNVMQMRGLLWLLCAAMSLTVALSQPALADEQAAQQFATDLADEAIAVLGNSDLSESGKQNQLKELFSESIDLNWVARFVLGKHWRSTNMQQRKAYLSAYKRFIINNFTDRLSEYSGQQYRVKQVRQDGEAGEYLLTLELTQTGEPSIYLDYRLREYGASFKIFDIVIEGVSLITTQRSEFNSVIERKGLEFLISALEKRAGA